jgi:hypothetical protein
MTGNDLRRTLEQLHLDLSQNPNLDSSTVQSLRTLAEDIQKVLERASSDGEVLASDEVENTTLADRMRGLIADFEVQHPQLTSTLSTIAERLSDMGI